MPKLKPISPKKLITQLEKNGFIIIGQKGSHVKLKKAEKIIIIPIHSNKDIGTGLLLSIIKKELKISKEDFNKLLEA